MFHKQLIKIIVVFCSFLRKNRKFDNVQSNTMWEQFEDEVYMAIFIYYGLLIWKANGHFCDLLEDHGGKKVKISIVNPFSQFYALDRKFLVAKHSQLRRRICTSCPKWCWQWVDQRERFESLSRGAIISLVLIPGFRGYSDCCSDF